MRTVSLTINRGEPEFNILLEILLERGAVTRADMNEIKSITITANLKE